MIIYNMMRGKSTVGVGGRKRLYAEILKIFLCEYPRSPSEIDSLKAHNTPTAAAVLQSFAVF
jgi:hypothetical protein